MQASDCAAGRRCLNINAMSFRYGHGTVRLRSQVLGMGARGLDSRRVSESSTEVTDTHQTRGFRKVVGQAVIGRLERSRMCAGILRLGVFT